MATRGRKSIAALTTPTPIQVINRPAVPLDLTAVEGDVWLQMVGAMPADWFPPETWPLLRQYCRHTVSARRVAQLVDAAMSRRQVDTVEVRDLLAMQAKETSALKAMAASMRLSQQASYSARGAGGEKKRREPIDAPWEFTGEEE